MTEHIQPLLERIQSEGLAKAESERDSILKQARSKADDIIESANKEAENIRRQAETDAEASRKSGEATLQQAARDLLLRLRTELSRQLHLAAKTAAGSSLSSTDRVSELIKDLVAARTDAGTVTVEANRDLAEKIKPLLPALLRDAGAEGGEIVMNPKTGAGFHLQFSNSPEGMDVSAEAVADWLSAMIRPELASLLQPESASDGAAGD